MRKIVTQGGQIQEIRSGGTGATGNFGTPQQARAAAALPPPAAQAPLPAPGHTGSYGAPPGYGQPPGMQPLPPPPGYGGGPAPQLQAYGQGVGAPPQGPPPGIAPARMPGMTQSFSRGVIKQQVVGAYGQAKEILGVAEQEAARIIQDAERIREEQAKVGYDEGYKKGYEEALGKLADLEREVQHIFAEIEPKVVQLSVKVAEKIIGEEMATRPDAIARIVSQALRTVRHQREVVVRVHPSAVETLERQKKTLLGVLSRARDVEIRGDPQIREGGCIIETELGLLDADLHTQLEILERALGGGLKQEGGGGGE